MAIDPEGGEGMIDRNSWRGDEIKYGKEDGVELSCVTMNVIICFLSYLSFCKAALIFWHFSLRYTGVVAKEIW